MDEHGALVLLYGLGGLSLRSTASFAVEAGIADVCDVSLLDRLRNCPEWLEYVLGQLLQITPARPAEALDRVAVLRGDLILQDRGYGRAGNLAHASGCWQPGSRQRTRSQVHQPRRALRLVDANHAPFDIIAALPHSGPDIVELPVAIVHKTREILIRLIIKRKSDEAASHERKRRESKARNNGQVNDPRTITAAGFGGYVTSLSLGEPSAGHRLPSLWRCWQIARNRLPETACQKPPARNSPIAAIFTVTRKTPIRHLRRTMRHRRDEPPRRRINQANAARSALS